MNVGFSGVVGLRYEGCAAILAAFPELATGDVWTGLAIIEAYFLIEQSRRQDKNKRAKDSDGRRRR